MWKWLIILSLYSGVVIGEVKMDYRKLLNKVIQDLGAERYEKAAMLATGDVETKAFKSGTESAYYRASKIKELNQFRHMSKDEIASKFATSPRGMLKRKDSQGNYVPLKKGERLSKEEIKNRQKAFLNIYYADANRGSTTRLGNTQEGDGWNFRGRGLFQITGRELYTKLSKALFPNNPNKLLDNPELLSTDKDVIKRAAKWYWETKIRSKLSDFSDMDKVTNIVNKHTGSKQY